MKASKKNGFVPGKLYIAREHRAWMVNKVYAYPIEGAPPFLVPEDSVFMFVKVWDAEHGNSNTWSVFLCGDQLVLAQYGLLKELK